MALILSHDNYYSEQMQFIDRYLRAIPTPTDQKRLQRVKQKQNKQCAFFLDEFLDRAAEEISDSLKVAHNPRPQKSEESTLSKNHLNRYRIVYGPIDFYLDNQLDEPTEINIITACAPNLTGTSTVDLQDFSIGEGKKRQLKTVRYADECNKLADFIVKTAKNQGNTRLVMSDFGLRSNLSQLDGISKETAKKLMYQAFASAAEVHKLHIDWLVLFREFNPAQAAKQLTQYAPSNPYISPLIQESFLGYTKTLYNKKEKFALLNSSTDLNIGGDYTRKHLKTDEEQIAQCSDLLLLHTNLNQTLMNQFNLTFRRRKQNIATPTTQEEDNQYSSSCIAIPQNSCLNKQQISEVVKLIQTLKKESTSFWSVNKDRKQVKHNALIVLIKESGHYSCVSELANYIMDQFPQANKGIVSNRTGELLLRLKGPQDQKIPLTPL